LHVMDSVQDGTDLHGYLQSEKFFLHCKTEIKRLLKPNLTGIKPLPDKSIAVHVRRGDYDGKKHLILDVDYYKAAIWKIRDKVGADHKAFVFSDEPSTAYKMFRYELDNFEVIAGGTERSDFATMTTARHHVIANSSFSWWSAWLGERANSYIIAPEKWFGDGTTDKHIVPTRWERL